MGIEAVIHKNMLHLNQQKYVHKLLLKCGLFESKEYVTPMAIGKGLNQANAIMLEANDAIFYMSIVKGSNTTPLRVQMFLLSE